jgi:hypothetical protein
MSVEEIRSQEHGLLVEHPRRDAEASGPDETRLAAVTHVDAMWQPVP